MPHVCVYLDDILITEEIEAETLAKFKVLAKLLSAGMCYMEKYIFQASEVVHLGHKINAEGLHPVEEKICVIT